MCKILIIGPYNFTQLNATSITLNNLFSNFNSSQIAFINTGYFPEEDVLSFHFNINKTFFRIGKFSKYKSPVFGFSSSSSSSSSLKNRLLNKIHLILSGYFSLIYFSNIKSVYPFIDNFRPDYIYSLLGSVKIMRISIKISKKYNVPIIPHFMDDWPSVQFKNQILLYPARFSLEFFIKRVLKHSKFGLVISEKMAIEYNKRYGLDFFPFMNCFDEEFSFEDDSSSLFRLVYAGGLHLERYNSLLKLCEALNSLSNKFNFKFDFFLNDLDYYKYYSVFSNFVFVKFNKYVNNREIISIYKNSTILIHVESFSDIVKDYIRYSISTKIPEYLSCSKFIISIGPSHCASIEYLRENKASLIFDENSISKMEPVLIDFLYNSNKYNYLKTNAFSLFKKNHLKNDQANKFKKLICHYNNNL